MERSSFLQLIGLSTIGMGVTGISDFLNTNSFKEQTEKMPVLFIGHGSPMNAVEDNVFVQEFKKLSMRMPEPKAIICISAHWLTRGTYVTAMQTPRTIHDFQGFPQALYDIKYNAQGSPELAQSIKDMVEDIVIHHDLDWGLDHGTWSILRNIYPDAQIPVLQLSIDWNKPMSYHVELAKKLSQLREKGVLMIGSGNIVHNLGMVDFSQLNNIGYGYDWALEARKYVNDRIMENQINDLINYDKGPTCLKLAIPTPDHFIPLLYSIGLRRQEDNLVFFNDEVLAGSLSMTSVMYS